MNRRRFLRRCAGATLGFAASGLTYSLLEAKWCTVSLHTIKVRRLPPAFAGLRVALLGDIHHGPYVPLAYVRHIVNLTNALQPDLIALVGDNVHRGSKYIDPCLAELSRLRAAEGRFAVRGNHDNWEGRAHSQKALTVAGFVEVTNRGVWLQRAGARLRICGVGDSWTDRVSVPQALDSATDRDASILLAHNPEETERVTDPRVSLILSGHTHGGQVVLPWFGPPILPVTGYPGKYVQGWVEGPVSPVFITRGLGTITPPVRFCCRPEVVLLTLTPA
jgi:predicted MPP superfamily phosphohydrolase